MAPPQKSRKGKKAWRKNISSTEVEEFLQEKSYQERRGPAARDLKDDQLFFVDTSADVENAQAVATGKRPKRRRDEPKLTRAQQILAESGKVKPVPLTPPSKKPKTASGPGGGKQQQQEPAAGKQQLALARKGGKAGSAPAHALDLWGDEDLAPAPPAKRKVHKAAGAGAGGGGGSSSSLREMGPSAPHLRMGPPPVAQRMKAVEVDMPGCSFNPDREQQQDALALLVAAEMKKELVKELRPAAPPAEVEGGAGPRSELDDLQVDADASSDGEGHEGDGDGQDGQEGGATRRKAERRKTQKDRNRAARRKAVEKELQERSRLKAQRRALAALPVLEAQIAEEKGVKELKHQRLVALREDRATAEPPRLGKQRFEPHSVQVLTSDEITGCLRQLKPCSMLATERFKSIQKRGIIEPRKPQALKEKRRRVMYEKGARTERQQEATDEVRSMAKTNKKQRAALKRASANGLADDEF